MSSLANARPGRAALLLACCSMMISGMPAAAQGEPAAPKEGVATFDPVPTAPPEAPGIYPGDPRKLTGIWKIERFIFLIPDTPMLPATKAIYDNQVAAMNGGQIL